MMNRNIVLFGFMGCGKSTVGAELSSNIGRVMVDTDKLIEQREGMSVSEIFSTRGEGYFRDREHEICRELSERERLIISAGGGALTFRRNIEALRKGCELVLIDVPPEVIRRRYYAGLEYFFKIYAPVCDKWMLVDNSKNEFQIVAEGTRKGTTVRNRKLYKQIQETTHDSP